MGLTEAIFEENSGVKESVQSPEAIQRLNLLLPIKCPPLPSMTTTERTTTAESLHCSIGCNERFKLVEQETENLSYKVAEMIKVIEKYEKKFIELENKLENLSCSCSTSV